MIGFEVSVASGGQAAVHASRGEHGSPGVAVQGLDLDDVCSQVTHHCGGNRAELPDCPIHRFDALQRAWFVVLAGAVRIVFIRN